VVPLKLEAALGDYRELDEGRVVENDVEHGAVEVDDEEHDREARGRVRDCRRRVEGPRDDAQQHEHEEDRAAVVHDGARLDGRDRLRVVLHWVRPLVRRRLEGEYQAAYLRVKFVDVVSGPGVVGRTAHRRQSHSGGLGARSGRGALTIRN
jgi:hypothetical protein